MDPSPPFGTNADDGLRILSEDGGVVAWVDTGGEHRPLQPLWDDGERIYCRTWRSNAEGVGPPLMAVLPAAEHRAPTTISRLAHEFALKDYLDGAWAARPLELVHSRGQTLLLLETHSTCALDSLLGKPLELGRFLRLAPAITHAIGRLHERGLVHKDIKPANILLDPVTEQVWLTGFGIASLLPRERQAPEPLEFIAGTLAYMAPEQTGRMNRSIDSRSDLYALGVTFYQMLTGALPFVATDPMEWVHCHIARKPLAPDQRFAGIPPPLSDIVMKLLAKMAEERYQTAVGLEQDLRHCATQWESQQRIEPFTLGRHEPPGRLLITEKLYGRAREIAILRNAFDTIVKHPTTELILVSGYTGIGKSSVVNELHKALVPPRGLFASGKFDQYKRDIPYATLAQAFQRLIRKVLAKSEAELGQWREVLLHALEPHGDLIVGLVPELKLIVGEQEPVPELPASDAQRRFQLLLRRFIGVFARPEHPLALFLDDLQWLDAATLDLLEDLLTQESVPHLLLIGAYRDNEVDASHPLMRKLGSIKAAGTSSVEEIKLGALDAQHVSQLIADALHCETDQVGDLAQLILQKTDGNPFFINQFLSTLTDEGLIAFDSVHSRWSWDLTRIHAKDYTDNVADLMIGKLIRLPAATQQALQQLACLGNIATTAMLAIIHDTTEQELHASLVAARRQELVDFLESSYRFVHDRVHEAAYALIPTERRAECHLRIGRLLLQHIPQDKREEAIFEIVSQFEQGVALIASLEEREKIAELNLVAGKRARAAAAYASALKYFVAGTTLVAEDCWERRHDLILQLEIHRAECEFLIGDLNAAADRLTTLSSRAAGTVEQSAVECLRVDLYHTLYQPDRAIAVFLDYLKKQGIEWSPHPTSEEVQREYEGVYSRLGGRTIEDIIDLPLMSDPASLATLDVLTRGLSPTLLTDGNLLGLTICRMANLSLQHGNSDGSCQAYVWFGMIARTLFGNYEDGVRFGRLALELVEKKNLKRFQGRTYRSFAENVALWTEHIQIGCNLLRQAFEAANKIGDVTSAVYSLDTLGRLLLASGQPLAEVQREAEACLEFATAARFGFVIDLMIPRLGLIWTLRGLTTKFGLLDSEQFSEFVFEPHLAGDQRQVIAECFYCIRKLQARFYAGEYSAALAASQGAERLLSIPVAFVETAEYHFYTALCHAASVEFEDIEGRQRHLEALTAHHRQIAVWAAQCPENFENRAALLGAELARIEGRELEAERLYERAIRSARTNGFLNNEAIANEFAARFYASRGFEMIANAYLQEARFCYRRWGADGKVRQLDRLYPHLAALEEQRAAPTIGSPIQQLDVASVVKASQALSSEIVLPRLIERLMRIALENAGANGGLLILPEGDEYDIQAEARATGDWIEVTMGQKPITGITCPETLVRYVIRTREPVILDDASKSNLFAADDYLRDRQSKSILCLPLIKQQQLTGILFLENTLTSHAFTPHRIEVLELLAAQAAISLENTRLYSDLQEGEMKIRRLVDSNIIGILIGDIDGHVQEANQAFLQIIGYDQADVAADRLRRSELTPADWHDRDAQAVAEMSTIGTCRPYEKEYIRKDGSRVPVLVGGATFGERRHGVVAFAVDLTERRRAEKAARESEERYREVQMELAHANRVATMGQLTASIAHEVNQPIAAALTNAETAVRWLAAQPPDLERAKQAINRIVNEGTRAADIISGIRGLVKNGPPRMEDLAINEAILEVIALLRGELSDNRVSVQTQLAKDLPLIHGDRVQLQQVILNLIVNAIEAMSQVSGGPRDMLISAMSDPDSVRIAVQDSGPGLPQAGTERVFEAFFTTKPSGLGMGLSICHSIVEAHGGQLWTTPNEPHGAIFCFTLPIGEKSLEN